jgi:hypothetical protein
VVLIGGLLAGVALTRHALAVHEATRMNLSALSTAQAQQRFLEQNTMTLPSAGASIAAPDVVWGEQQRCIEENTITLPSVGGADVFTPMVPARRLPHQASGHEEAQ